LSQAGETRPVTTNRPGAAPAIYICKQAWVATNKNPYTSGPSIGQWHWGIDGSIANGELMAMTTHYAGQRRGHRGIQTAT
jgi:hypothetical protein